MPIDTKYRSNKVEIMDDFSLSGEALHEALDKIAKINQLLGGNRLTINGVAALLPQSDVSKEITILDLGCGNGDMLRNLAKYGANHNLKFKLIGIDANKSAIQYAQKLSVEFPEITFQCDDIFGNILNDLKYDIVLLTLTLHHFKDHEIEDLLAQCHNNARIGIVINDLHRSPIAYRLFQGLCIIFKLNHISKEDGLTSILRGFKKRELIPLAEKLNFKKYRIHWRWAFRYQWIISKI